MQKTSGYYVMNLLQRHVVYSAQALLNFAVAGLDKAHIMWVTQLWGLSWEINLPSGIKQIGKLLAWI